ncbi:hypothetical protein ACJX0J_003305 [Zea mays]
MTATIFSILRIPILFEKKIERKKKERVNNKTGYSFFFLQFFFLEILEKFSFKTDSCFTEKREKFRLFHINGSTFILIPILVFWISGLLAPVSEGPEKTHGGAWLQFRIRYYMFALVFVVFDVETVFLYPWAMSFDVLGVSVFIEAFIFVLILVVGLIPLRQYDELGGVLLCRKRKKRATMQQGCRDFTNKSGGLGLHIAVFYMIWLQLFTIFSLPKRIILESRLFSGDNKFMFTYTTQFQILFKASFLFSNLENHIFCLEIYLLTLEIYLLTLD